MWTLSALVDIWFGLVWFPGAPANLFFRSKIFRYSKIFHLLTRSGRTNPIGHPLSFLPEKLFLRVLAVIGPTGILAESVLTAGPSVTDTATGDILHFQHQFFEIFLSVLGFSKGTSLDFNYVKPCLDLVQL